MVKRRSIEQLSVVGLLGFAAFWAVTPAQPASGCVFPNGDKTQIGELIAVIKDMKASCALPWRALKRQAENPESKARIEAAYRMIAVKYPDQTDGVNARIADVEAAAGNPGPMLAIADANVIAHPEDKTLANMSCFARAAYGFDIEQAMPYCDAAVANGRPGYALVNRGKAELQLNRFREALADFQEALQTRRDLSNRSLIQAAYGQGIARLRLGDRGGQKDVDFAVKAYPEVTADFSDFGIRP